MRFTQISISIATAVLGLLSPLTALAAPDNVHNITLQKTADGVLVRWDAVSGDVASYKIFWSHESILENGALYDDVEDTKSAVGQYELKNLTPMNDIYVTVLAVSSKNEESPLFEEEAHLMIGNALAPPSSSSASSAQSLPALSSVSSLPLTPSGPFVIDLEALSVEVLSATGVLVKFNAPVVLDQLSARTGFTITDGAAAPLAIYRVKAEGDTVELHTLMQTKNKAYRLHIDSSVRGRTEGGDAVLDLSDAQTDLLFMGHETGIAQAQTVPATQGTASDVKGVQVKAAVDGTNTYSVEIAWQPPQGSILGYSVSQTRDGGKTYGAAQQLAANVQAVKMPKTQAGEVGLLIRTIANDQTLSAGVLQRVLLPQTGKVIGKSAVSSVPNRNTRLPQTGVGTGVLMAMAGACAAVKVQRRRAQQA